VLRGLWVGYGWLGGYRVNGVHGILYRITVRGSAYTQMTRERPVPGRGIARSREEVRRIERPETGINNEYKHRLIIQTKYKQRLQLSRQRVISTVAAHSCTLSCCARAPPAHPRNLLTIHKAHRLGLYSACHRPRVRVHARRFSFCTAADARATLALAHSRPRLPQRLAGGCRFGEVMRCCVAAVPHRG
jgi:hypothetical protein